MRRRLVAGGAVTAGVALVVAAVVVGVGGPGASRASSPPTSSPTSAATSAAPTAAPVDPLAKSIASAQDRLKRNPDDWQLWAELGLDYVQQAKVTVNPAYYPKAEGSLAKSLELMPDGNYLALAGQAALDAARHDFDAALAKTQAAAAINPYNAVIFGAMADAYTQLGRYDEAAKAVDTMLHLHPGTPAFSRLSYVRELAGDVDGARAALEQALVDAGTPADKAFAYYYLGELAFNAGDPTEALKQFEAGLEADPTYVALFEGRAKAEAALGDTEAAIADYTTVVSRVPQPSYLIEFGELLQSLGRTKQAQQQYALFDTEVALFESNGVKVELDPALFYANHGDPPKALTFAEQGWQQRPFLEVADAYAWALHENGRDAEALGYSHKALATGMRNALFYFHQGIIEKALGQREAAVTDLRTALEINPYFNPLQVPEAKAALAELGG